MRGIPIPQNELSDRNGVCRVNLGCGKRYHSEWINIDVEATGPDVIVYDLRRGIPIANNCCDVIYHSNVVEHMTRADAAAFMQECRRILKPGGIMRVATPDLEQICCGYLQKLQSAIREDSSLAEADHAWMVLELLDQGVRDTSGGEMVACLKRPDLPNERFIVERIGMEAKEILDALNADRHASSAPAHRDGRWRPLSLWRHRIRNRLLLWLLGREGLNALRVGRFRLSGEVHRWIYDRVSLRRLFLEAGFADPVVCNAGISAIGEWCRFELDVLKDGTVIKPDSLHMEARKPSPARSGWR